MNRLTWESFSFVPGMHSYHEYQRGGDIFPHDMANLRADGNGYLRQRSKTGLLSSRMNSGIASDPKRLWSVEDGGLYYLNADVRDGGGWERIEDLTASGRLWVVSEFRDFVIVKTEAEDGGYWIDVREDADTQFDGHPLGIDPPLLSRFNVNYLEDVEATEPSLLETFYVGLLNALGIPNNVISTDGFTGPLTRNRYYVFRMTYYRNTGATNVAQDGVDFLGEVADLFDGSESVFSAPFILYTGSEPNLGFATFVDNDSSEWGVIGRTTERALAFHGTTAHSADDQVTGIALYQSEAVEHTPTTRRVNIDKLTYRLIDAISREDSESEQVLGTNFRSRHDNWPDLPEFLYDNSRLPDGAAQITYFNDLVFAAVGDELRYTDFRVGVPTQWAWPEDNSINIEGEVLFCIEHRGVLLFGGPHGVWRLTGTDEFNFERDNISAVGPVSRGAFVKFETGIGFISTGGFYETNGVEVVKVSSPHLDGFFQENTIVEGAVTLLPSNDQLWSVELEDGTKRQFLKSIRGGWFGWEDVDVSQSTRSVRTDANGVRSDHVYYADGDSLKEMLWDDFSVDTELAWSWMSNVIDFKSEGHQEALKLFRWLEVSSEHAGEGTLTFWVDGVEESNDFMFAVGQRPVRIPINRRGEKIQFEISGTGEVVIRYLRLVADTRSRRTRF